MFKSTAKNLAAASGVAMMLMSGTAFAEGDSVTSEFTFCAACDDALTANDLAGVPRSEWSEIIENKSAPADADEFEGNLRNMIGSEGDKIAGQRAQNHAFNLVNEITRALKQDRDVRMPNNRYEQSGILQEFFTDNVGSIQDALAAGENANTLKSDLATVIEDIRAGYSEDIDALMDAIRNPAPEPELESKPELEVDTDPESDASFDGYPPKVNWPTRMYKI